MILRKPYAFFIKMFKPIHLLLAGILLYLIYISNNIIKFLNEYISSPENIIEKAVAGELISNLLYIIPIVLIIVFISILTVMFKKNKSVIFYFLGIFCFVAIIVINLYTANFFNIITENIVSVKTIKLIHDLVLIDVVIESVIFIFLLARGIGLDFKKFDFNSDALKMEINESDEEEIEVSINVDFNERKRKRKQRLRNLKYYYFEHRLLLNIIIIISVLLIIGISVFAFYKINYKNKEGVYYNTGLFTFKVNNTMILNTDYRGNKITDNYLIIVESSIKSNYSEKSLFLNDFSLKIGNVKFKPVEKYFDSLTDLGIFYDEQNLSTEYTDYIFAYEIPEKYINDEMYFSYNSSEYAINIFLQPKNLINTTESKTITNNITETLKFEEPLTNIEFKINDYDIKDRFLIEYSYCIKEDECYPSKEYLKASIDENYDKAILKLNVDYKQNSDLDVNTFYKLLSKFGSISYRMGNTWYSDSKFEKITSKRLSSKNDVYVGINSNILSAEAIKLLFSIRGYKYEYILK